MARYLVTGGCGFIGSHLVDALVAAGHDVRILDDLSTGKRENVPDMNDVVIGDVSNPDVIAKAMSGMDGCFHLAAIASVQRSNEEWALTHRVNLTGAVNVFDAARNANPAGPVPVVYASSAAVYGDNPAVPLVEDAEKRPLTAYGADKLGCEQHARVAGNVHDVPTTGFRFFNIYGPRQDPGSPYSGVISIFADRLASGKSATIFGDGGQLRDFVYVGDCVRFIIAGMDRATTGADVFKSVPARHRHCMTWSRLCRRPVGVTLMLRPVLPGSVISVNPVVMHPGRRLNSTSVPKHRCGTGWPKPSRLFADEFGRRRPGNQ